MSAGPFPTKVMHEALKTRVGLLENISPGASSSGAGLLSHSVSGGVTGKGAQQAIEPITSVRVTRPAGYGFSFNGFLFANLAWLTVTLTIDDVVVLNNSSGAMTFEQSGDDYVWRLDKSYYGNSFEFLFTVSGHMYPLYAKSSETASPGFSQEVSGESGVLPLTANFQILDVRTVYGALAPDAMNVSPEPSNLQNGEFEIVSGGGTPRLRFKAASGQIYAVEMTAEV